MDNYSLSDLAALTKNESGFGGGSGAWFLVILFLFLFAGGNGFGFGGNSAVANYATQADITNAINAQTAAMNQQSILLSSANNNYETARLIDNQSMAMMNQNNTNMIAAINGSNTVNTNLQSGFAGLQQSLCNLEHHLDECCCSIKTQMLQNRLDDANAALVTANGALSNAAQTQNILSSMGRWVAYPSVATTTTTTA